MKPAVAVTLTWALMSSCLAADDTLKKQLTDQYRGKVLALRHSFTAKAQEYDAQGTPYNHGDDGPWSLYGHLQVAKMEVEGTRLRVEGNRFYYAVGRDPEQKLKITIRSNEPLVSAEQATALLDRAFAMTPEEKVRSAPPYWQSYLARELHVQAPAKTAEGNNAKAENERVFTFGGDVTAPKVLYQPNPDFSRAASERKYQGTVGLTLIVDKTGRVRDISIAKPLGLGLDENAVQSVSTWRFSPAMRHGEPVSVSIYVEVDYHFF
jgi:TonB family protein